MAFVQYAYQDQNRNWRGSAQAPADDNDDKKLTTQFVTVGAQYMFNRSWGMQLELPYDFRHFTKIDDNTGNLVTRNWSQVGDLRIEGIYTGFFADLSAGLTLGVKLPTGDFSHAPEIVDRDSQIGTGSTDLVLGGFYRGKLTADRRVGWFAQLQLDVPVLTQDHYRPGVELDTAAGVDYDGIKLGGVSVIPVAQVIFSERTSDGGANAASPVASGYQRILLSPGIEFHLHPFRFYADAEIPVYQNFTGNQLAASWLVKASFSIMF